MVLRPKTLQYSHGSREENTVLHPGQQLTRANVQGRVGVGESSDNPPTISQTFTSQSCVELSITVTPFYDKTETV